MFHSLTVYPPDDMLLKAQGLYVRRLNWYDSGLIFLGLVSWKESIKLIPKPQ